MNWELIAGVAAGLAIGEYYRRVFDRIRKEQLEILRDRRQSRPRSNEPETFDELDRPQRRPLVTPEKFDEYRRTGSTAGKRVNGETV